MKFLHRVLGRDTTADGTATNDDARAADDETCAQSTGVQPATTSNALAEAQQGPSPAASSATTSVAGDGQPVTSSVSTVVSEHGSSAASDVGVVAVGAEGSAAASEIGTAAVGPDAGAATSNGAGSTTVAVLESTDCEGAVVEPDENGSDDAAACERTDDD